MTKDRALEKEPRVSARVGFDEFTAAVSAAVLRAIESQNIGPLGPITAGIWIDLESTDVAGPVSAEVNRPSSASRLTTTTEPASEFEGFIQSASNAVLRILDDRNIQIQGSTKVPRVKVTMGIVRAPLQPAK